MDDIPPLKIDRLVRSRRKSIALVVGLDGSLTVRAPLHLPRASIDAFVQEKAGWVQEKRAEARLQREKFGIHQYAPGELFWFLGEQYALELVPAKKPVLRLDGTFQLASHALPQAREAFVQWYRRQARRVIGERVELQATRLGLRYEQLRIGGARTRWGSCSSKKNLRFTWRLVMAPLAVIDYVVVHELCHLLEPNHSRAFWARVEAALPDYKERRAWLRKNGQKFDLN